VSAHVHAAPANKPLFTGGVRIMLALMAVGLGFAVARFVWGLGAVTHLNNQFPWGIWIAIDVASGVALAAGGFTTAALAHIFHREHYETVTRPALLTAVLGYTFVVLGLLVDLGRYYNVWHPMLPMMWSGHSVLFEVGMCVMLYLTVLYIEFLPIVVERFKGRVHLPRLPRAERALEAVLAVLDRTLSRVMFVFVILGVVLSTLHQSSLGGLMVIAPYKVHPLWWTPILPLLFFLSAVSVGFAMVVFESMITSKSLGRKPEMDVLAPLAKMIPVILFIYLAFKVGDLTQRDAWVYLGRGGFQAWMFLAEVILGVVAPMVILSTRRGRRTPALLFTGSALVVFGVLFNRINVFLTAYTPMYMEKRYFPSIGEIAITVGLAAGLMFVYRVIITYFPVLPVEEPEALPAEEPEAVVLEARS
jgi:Ni/Fe-hydrogenase subunit HybB-like protein